jgi:SOS-response transcriptional repressor LexA
MARKKNWDAIHREWIKDGTHKTGKSAAKMASFMADYFNDENYRDPKHVIYKITGAEKRKITNTELIAFSIYLSEPIPAPKMQETALPEPKSRDEIPIIGELRAGHSIDPAIIKSSNLGTVTLPKDKDFPDARRLAFIQKDESMKSAKINNGDILICIEPTDKIVPAEGSLVIVETIDNKRRIELSARIFTVLKDRIEYRSSDSAPLYKPVVVMNNEKESKEKVRVVAIIRQSTPYF